jgi:hypothetical protein
MWTPGQSEHDGEKKSPDPGYGIGYADALFYLKGQNLFYWPCLLSCNIMPNISPSWQIP